MIEILGESTENCMGFKVTGKLATEDYDALIPKLDEALAAWGKINMFVLVEGLEGWDGLGAAKADFAFGKKQYRSVERCAFVSDRNWHKWVVKLIDPFTSRTKEAFFEPSQIEEAWAWAKT
jgi:hypothetical protein